MNKLKEQINEIFDRCYVKGSPDYPKLLVFQRQKALNEILNLLSEELEKLTVIGDEGIKMALKYEKWEELSEMDRFLSKNIAQVQLNHTKEQIKKALGE